MNHRSWSTLATAALLALCVAAAWADTFPSRSEDCNCYGIANVRDGDGDGVVDRIDRCINTPKGCSVDAWGCQTDEDGDGVCDGLDQCPNSPRGEQVDAHGCSAGQRALNSQDAPPAQTAGAHDTPAATPAPPKASKPVSEMERQLVEGGRIRLENVYFETNSANLLPESEATLNEAGETLEKFPALRIEVQGHTDTRGSDRYNMRLSGARAESVRRYLLEHFHLDAGQYVAKGYGETDPETRERNDEELLRNRRVVLNVLNPQDLPRGVKLDK